MSGLRASVVVPVHNRPDDLRRCLESLADQDWPAEHFEVLVCDDASDDDLTAILKASRNALPNLRLLRQNGRRGPAAARNMGFRAGAGEIFVCVDSDVTCSPDFLRRLVAAMDLQPGWVAAAARVVATGGSNSPLWDAPVNDGGSYLSAACAYRREALTRSGGFDESFLLPACEDADLAARLFRLGAFGFVGDAVVSHPRRRITMGTHWRWRRHWKYVMILAKRYGFLAFPGRSAGRFPRLRVALSAVVSLPAGRFRAALKHLRHAPPDALRACGYALFDVVCGLWALPGVLFGRVPPFRSSLKAGEGES